MRTIGGVLAACLLLCSAAHGFNAEDLIKDLKEGTGEKQLAAAMRLVDFVKYPEVIAALEAKLGDAAGDAVVRSNCAQSLARSEDASVYPMLLTLAKKEAEKPIVRASCAASIAVAKPDLALSELVAMLKTEKSALVRAQIEASLGRMPDPQRVVVAVSPLLKEPDAEASAIRVLGVVGGAAVIPPLAKQLTEGKASSRRAVIQALGSIRRPESAAALVQFYPKANDAEKVDILGMLSVHPHPEAVALMISEMDNLKAFPAVRRRAALSLGNLRAPQGIAPLVKVLLNTAESEGMRITCAQSLSNFTDRDDAAIAGLIGALADKKIAEEASLALARMTRRYFGADKDKWTQWFQQWREERDRPQRVGH